MSLTMKLVDHIKISTSAKGNSVARSVRHYSYVHTCRTDSWEQQENAVSPEANIWRWKHQKEGFNASSVWISLYRFKYGIECQFCATSLSSVSGRNLKPEQNVVYSDAYEQVSLWWRTSLCKKLPSHPETMPVNLRCILLCHSFTLMI
jgi:hypothetical protein